MTELIGANRTTLWIQRDLGSPLELMDVGKNSSGFTGKSLPAAGTTAIYGKGINGRPILIAKTTDAPGDLPGGTITIYDRGTFNFLLQMYKRGCPIMVQQRIVECGDLDRPLVYDVADVWANGELNTYTPGDGPIQEFDGQFLTVSGELSFDYMIRVLESQLSRLTTTEVQDLNVIDGIASEDCNECDSGYPGADKIMYVGADAEGAGIANIIATEDGGSVWAVLSALPFAADEHVTSLVIQTLTESTYRVIVGTSVTDAGAAQTAYADFTYGDLLTASWTVVTIGSATEVVEALARIEFSKLYAGVSSDIYRSEDQGVTYSLLFTGSNAINAFAAGPDGSVWAVGDTNLILREQGFNGVFSAFVGPAGGAAFTAISVAENGTIYAGNGTTLFLNRASALNAGTWVTLRDFSAIVEKIQVVGGLETGLGYSETIRVLIADGTMHESVDGGASFKQIPNLTNSGYADAYFSKVDENLATIVGAADGGTGLIHKLAPVE